MAKKMKDEGIRLKDEAPPEIEPIGDLVAHDESSEAESAADDSKPETAVTATWLQSVPMGMRRFQVMQPIAQICHGQTAYPVVEQDHNPGEPFAYLVDLPGNEHWYLDLLGGLLKSI